MKPQMSLGAQAKPNAAGVAGDRRRGRPDEQVGGVGQRDAGVDDSTSRSWRPKTTTTHRVVAGEITRQVFRRKPIVRHGQNLLPRRAYVLRAARRRAAVGCPRRKRPGARRLRRTAFPALQLVPRLRRAGPRCDTTDAEMWWRPRATARAPECGYRCAPLRAT